MLVIIIIVVFKTKEKNSTRKIIVQLSESWVPAVSPVKINDLKMPWVSS